MKINKKIVQINTVCNTSTGQIMHDIQLAAQREGYDTISFVGRRKVYTDLKCEKFGNFFSFWTHVVLTVLFDCQGYGSFFSTKKLIKRLREEKPDIIHLHNLHGYYLNLPLLFRYLDNEFKGKIYWTFHDCWPFTGHCPYFVMAECDKWKRGCYKCPQKSQYPISLCFDASSLNYRRKKAMFTALESLVIITPSEWMKDLVKASFFNTMQVNVINNGIDIGIFHPCQDIRQLRDVLHKYNIPSNKKILLGVASIWEKRKGLDLFISLAEQIPEKYIIVLVGLTPRQIKRMPKSIIGLVRVESKEELAILYSSSQIFINPSMEESFSLVTVEAMACGTPVIALDTSAVKELVDTESGIVLSENKPEAYIDAIQRIENAEMRREKIAESACKYSKERMVDRVLQLYRE
ncbi:MAG: glycosyltransferase [Lachnospiraceae bacterium]|nr:glycosyltransferase [Lachnospiraceae bacterium]